MDKIIEKKIITKKKLIFFSILALFILFLLYFLIISPYKSTVKVKSHHISVSMIIEDTFQDFVTVNGTLHPERTIIIDAMEGGKVEEIFVREGEYIKKGDIILRLSNTNLQMSMMNREAELADQINNLRNTRLIMEQNRLSLKGQLLDSQHRLIQSKREYLQKKELFDKNLISNNEYQIAYEEYTLMQNRTDLIKENIVQDSLFRFVQIEQLNESVKRLQTNLEFIRDKMDGLIIKAPVEGQLSVLSAEIGESKHSGEKLGSINVIDNFKIQANISEFYLNRVTADLSALAESDNVNYQVSISRIHPEIRNGSFTVEFKFKDELIKNLRIGQSFIVRLELGGSKKSVLLARGGFYRSTGGQWVFVLDSDGKKARKREIKIGLQNPDYYEVISGLYPGEKVITSAYDNFMNAEILKISSD